MTDPIANQVESWAVVIEGDSQTVVIEHLREYAVACDPPPDVLVVTSGDQGPPGPPGPDGSGAVQSIAGHAISALRAVYELDGQVYPLDYRDSAHIDLLLGITITAGVAGQLVNVQHSGVLDDNGWSWTPGRIWLGADGALTQTPPLLIGFDVLIGSATSSTRIVINLQDPIALE